MVMSDTVVVEVMATSPKKNKNSSIRSSVQVKLVDERGHGAQTLFDGSNGFWVGSRQSARG